MSEADIIANTPSPRTRASLADDLTRLGVKPGMILLVHSSLSSLGWVNGGSVAVIQALQDALSPEGTLVMPAHSGDLSDPARWENPPVPESWWEVIRQTMPAYDPQRTYTRGLGQIAEHFRTWPDVLRSDHPALSFCAWGQQAEDVIRDHQINDALGEDSPLAHIYNMNGYVLLLGVGFDSNTSFHLAEYRLPHRKDVSFAAPVIKDGQRIWATYQDVDLNSDPFPQIGEAFEREKEITVGKVGSGTSRLFSLQESVDFAVTWLRTKGAGESTG